LCAFFSDNVGRNFNSYKNFVFRCLLGQNNGEWLVICVVTPVSDRICIIEDDEGIQDVLKIILRNEGYETTAFTNGEAIMENNYIQPDLFLVDKQLPGIDGLIICEYLKSKRETKDIPVVMMSAHPNVKKLALCAGANDFIEKPFSKSVLLQIVKVHLQNRKGHIA